MEKVNNLIAERLSEIVNTQVEFEQGVLVTISRVAATAGLGLARVFITCLPDEKTKEVIKILYKNKRMLRAELGRMIKLRRVPKFSFYIESGEMDAGEENENRVNEILGKLEIEK